ncbi:MAG: hypothetical protein JO266_19630 [Acidobacteria bacterium]|nr:hypothetical protein [Acidobacteriota bacterium]
MRRIVTLIRDNMAQLRQVESGTREVKRSSGKTARAKNTDPKLAQIASQFSQFEIERSRGGYLIYDPRRQEPIARLRPIPNTDRFELFYWSNVHSRWRTFGNLGRLKLPLEDARDIVENDPMFRIPRSR